MTQGVCGSWFIPVEEVWEWASRTIDKSRPPPPPTPRKKNTTFTEAVFFCFVFNLSKTLRCFPPAPLCSGQLQAMPPFGSQAVSLGLSNKWERAGVQRLPPFTDRFGGKLGWRGLPVQSSQVQGTARSPLTAELEGLLAFSVEGLVSSAG